MPDPQDTGEVVGLKPCPFCGGEAGTSTYETESLWSHDIVTYTKVGCGECDIEFSTEPGYDFEAPAAWNRRAPDPEAATTISTLEADRDRLRVALEEGRKIGDAMATNAEIIARHRFGGVADEGVAAHAAMKIQRDALAWREFSARTTLSTLGGVGRRPQTNPRGKFRCGLNPRRND